jgi:UDPglucose 6-dehydrogenase
MKCKLPIYEPGLQGILRQVVASGNLVATNDLRSSVLTSEVSIITVGTPFGDGGIDLSYIEDSAREIGTALREKTIIILCALKSTVVPTTTDTLVKDVLKAASGKEPGEFGLTMNPEFLREGKAVGTSCIPTES